MSNRISSSVSNVQYAAEVLQTALGDEPAKPPGCLKLIIACLDVLRDHVQAGASPCNASNFPQDDEWAPARYPGTFQRIMGFLAVSWNFSTEGELRALARRLWLCRCRAGPLARVCRERRFSDLHDSVPIMSPAITLGDVVTSMADIIMATADLARHRGSLYKVARNRRRAARAGKALPFPAAPSDLLPGGPGMTINALCLWLALDCDGRIMALIRSIVQVCQAEVVPAIATSRLLLEDIKETASKASRLISARGSLPCDEPFYFDLIRAAEFLRALDECATNRDGSAFASLGDASETLQVCQFLLCAIRRLQNVSHVSEEADVDGSPNLERRPQSKLKGDTSSDLDFVLPATREDPESSTNTSGAQDEAARALSPRTADLCTIYEAFLTLGAWAVQNGSPVENHPAIPPPEWDVTGEALRDRAEMLRKPQDVYKEAIQALSGLSSLQRCCAPGCSKTYISECRKFGTCSGCRRVPYCSIECQRWAFCHPDHPHKAVCQYIRLMRELGELHGGKLDPGAPRVPFPQNQRWSRVCRRVLEHIEFMHSAV